MKENIFDDLTKAIATATSRRQALKRIGGILGGTALAGLFPGLARANPLQASNACTPVPTSIQSNFNGTAIPAGDYIWFSSVLKVQGLPSGQSATVLFQNQSITFSANGHSYTLPVPDGQVQIMAGATSATTTFVGSWQTTVPSNASGNAFLSGFAFPVPAGGLPGGINPVTWSGTLSAAASVPVTVQWQWAAAVYTSFTQNYSLLGVKASDDNHYPPYQNSDHAGTPENYKSFVTGGARGGGGSNYTGSLSGTTSVRSGNCTLCTPSGGPCTHDSQCCSGDCDQQNNGTCAPPCTANGGPCTSPSQCCSNHCDPYSGTCVCAPLRAFCERNTDCCSGVCDPTNRCVV